VIQRIGLVTGPVTTRRSAIDDEGTPDRGRRTPAELSGQAVTCAGSARTVTVSSTGTFSSTGKTAQRACARIASGPRQR